MNTMVHRDYEQTLIKIARILPPDRVEQLIDFARFLEAQIMSEDLLEEEDAAIVEAENAQWDALLATDEAQALLEQLANEALAEDQAGRTRPMAFDDEGRIVPG